MYIGTFTHSPENNQPLGSLGIYRAALSVLNSGAEAGSGSGSGSESGLVKLLKCSEASGRGSDYLYIERGE